MSDNMKALRVKDLAYFKGKQDAFNEGKFVQQADFVAEANVLEGVKVNGTALAIAGKMVDILIATGSTNGTISVNGTDVSIAGLMALAYKSEVAYSDLASALQTVIDGKAEASALTAIIGSDTGKTIRAISAEEVAKIVANADTKYDTLKEIADWIMSDSTGAAKMANDITALQGKLTLGTDGNDDEYATVKAYVEAVVEGLNMSQYVEKVAGKGLSTEDYTTVEKQKLAAIDESADVNVIEAVKVNGSALTPDAAKAVDVTVPTTLTDLDNDGNFVQDVSYVHTDSNYTADEKTKLGAIASGAQVNVIESVSVNNEQLAVTAKGVNIAVPTTVAELTDATNYQTALEWAGTDDIDALFVA